MSPSPLALSLSRQRLGLAGWLAFATAAIGAVWRLNPALLG